MNKRRIFAWIGIIFIPLMFFISIILSLLDAPIAPAFLMATIILTVVIPTAIYLLTKYPEHIADIFASFRSAADGETETETEQKNDKNRSTKNSKKSKKKNSNNRKIK